jgi:hypothetical protein
MSAPAWTPGPWFAVNAGSDEEPMMSVKAARIAGREPRHEVAICATGDSPQMMENANAALIAAAPDLYAALSAILADSVSADPDMTRMKLALAAGDAALAKARGEQP